MHAIIYTEKIIEQARRFRCILPQQRGEGAIKLTIEETAETPKVPIIAMKEITPERDLEKISMIEIGNIIRIPENTPPVIRPLVDILKYNKITYYRDQLLLGKALCIPLLYPHTNKYLKELQKIRKILTHQSHSYFSN